MSGHVVSEFIVEEWTPVERGLLLGFATIRLQQTGMRMHCISVRRREAGGYFVLPSGRPRFGQDDKVVRNADDGHVAFQPLVSFVSSAARERFSDGVVAALIKYGALDGEVP